MNIVFTMPATKATRISHIRPVNVNSVIVDGMSRNLSAWKQKRKTIREQRVLRAQMSEPMFKDIGISAIDARLGLNTE